MARVRNASERGTSGRTGTPPLTCSLLSPLGPQAPGLPEHGHGVDGGPEHGPAEHRHRVHADELPHVGAVAAPQESHDVWPHVVHVLLPEVLVGTGAGSRSLVLARKGPARTGDPLLRESGFCPWSGRFRGRSERPAVWPGMNELKGMDQASTRQKGPPGHPRVPLPTSGS